MDENKKEKIGLRIHERLTGSIKRQQRLWLIQRVAVAAIFLCVFSGIYYSIHLNNNPSEVNIHKGNHLTADFRAGYLSLDGRDSIKLTELSNDSLSLPIEAIQEEGMMVVRTVSNQFTENDSIRINVQKGGFYKVILDDGSCVYLNSDSKIAYTGGFLDNREVYVEGEAYFEVSKVKRNGALQPFVVHTQHQKIEVLGTAFNVRTHKGAREEITLVEGKVRLNQKGASKPINLWPDMKATITKGGEMKVENVDTELYSAWKEGFFYYEDTPLKDILEDLARYYEIDFVKNEVPDLRYTLYLERKFSFSKIIALIEKSSGILINLENKTLKFSTKKK